MYTYDDWKALTAKLSITNKIVAEITGLSEQTVKNQISPSKKLPTWARSMIYMDRQESIQDLIKEAKNVLNDEIPQKPNCDCYIDHQGFFRRGKSGCKISKENHPIWI